MNGIIYYSNTNQSKIVADYFANKTGWTIYDLNKPEQTQKALAGAFEKAVLVFPVYCQNMPDIVKVFLSKLNARFLTVVATYGKMCYGRVLYEIQKSYTAGKIVAAAYVPMKHSYLQTETDDNLDALYPLVKKTLDSNPAPITLNKTYKNPFADIGKDMRSRMLVSIWFDESKCIECGKCERECLFGGIKNHKTNSSCIRCLKCVTNCPAGALSFHNSFPLRVYLKKKSINNCEIYI